MTRPSLTRRTLARSGLALALTLALPATTLAQGAERWPDKPIRLIVLGTAGASADVLARTVGAGGGGAQAGRRGRAGGGGAAGRLA